MRCAKCSRRAEIVLRYARLALCKEHFVEYIHGRVSKILAKAFSKGFPRKIAVCVSGGKDSMALLDMMYELSREMNFDIVALHIDLGIEPLKKARKTVEEYCSMLGVELYIVEVKEILGMSIDRLAKISRRDPCSLCGIVKRYIFNVFGLEKGFAIATGHHLDDAVAFYLKYIIFGSEQQFKMSSVITPVPGACPKIRPLMKVSEREIVAYVLLKNIPYVQNLCPYATENTINSVLKYALNIVEKQRPGAKLSLVNKLEREYEKNLSKMSEHANICRYCGVIAQRDMCSFCYLTSRTLGKPMGYVVRQHIRVLKPFQAVESP